MEPVCSCLKHKIVMDKELDWSHLSFGYIPTDCNVRCCFRDGKWGDIEVSQSETIDLHIAATCLH